MNKFHREKFSLRNFENNMVLASMDLWDIVNESKNALVSNPNPKVLKEYQRRVKKNYVHHRPQLGGQPTCVYQELQKTHGGVKNPL